MKRHRRPRRAVRMLFDFPRLPTDVQSRVLCFLPAADMCRARRVSRGLCKLFDAAFVTLCVETLGRQMPASTLGSKVKLLKLLQVETPEAQAKLLNWACKNPAFAAFLHSQLLREPALANTKCQSTPLLCTACQHRNLDAVRLLLLFGADVNATGATGFTALHTAVAAGATEAAKLLTGRAPLAFPVHSDNRAAAYRVLGPRWATVGIGAAQALQDEELARIMAETGEGRGRTRRLRARQRAAAAAAAAIKPLGLKRDLSVEVDVAARNDGGESPLYLACLKGHVRLVVLLLCHYTYHSTRLEQRDGRRDEFDTDRPWPTEVDPDGRPTPASNTPLGVACAAGNTFIVRHLLRWGANVNEPGFEGNTPLMQAVANGHEMLVGYLLERCPPAAVTADFSLLDALRAEREHLAGRLARRQERINAKAVATATADAAAAGVDVDRAVAVALAAIAPSRPGASGDDPDPNYPDDVEEDPFMPSVGSEMDPDASLDVDAVNLTNKTALFSAASIGKHASVRMLLVCGADHRVLTKRRKNAIYAAVEGGHVEVVKVLLSKSTPDDLRVSTNYGTTAMHVVTKSGDKLMKELLHAFCHSFSILEAAREAEERKRAEGDAKERKERAKRQEARMARLAGMPPAAVRERMRKLRERMLAAGAATQGTGSGGRKRSPRRKRSTSPRAASAGAAAGDGYKLPAITRGGYRNPEDDWMLAPAGVAEWDEEMRALLAMSGGELFADCMLDPPSLQQLSGALPPSASSHLAGSIQASHTRTGSGFGAGAGAGAGTSGDNATPSAGGGVSAQMQAELDDEELMRQLAARREAKMRARQERIMQARRRAAGFNEEAAGARAPTGAGAGAGAGAEARVGAVSTSGTGVGTEGGAGAGPRSSASPPLPLQAPSASPAQVLPPSSPVAVPAEVGHGSAPSSPPHGVPPPLDAVRTAGTKVKPAAARSPGPSSTAPPSPPRRRTPGALRRPPKSPLRSPTTPPRAPVAGKGQAAAADPSVVASAPAAASAPPRRPPPKRPPPRRRGAPGVSAATTGGAAAATTTSTSTVDGSPASDGSSLAAPHSTPSVVFGESAASPRRPSHPASRASPSESPEQPPRGTRRSSAGGAGGEGRDASAGGKRRKGSRRGGGKRRSRDAAQAAGSGAVPGHRLYAAAASKAMSFDQHLAIALGGTHLQQFQRQRGAKDRDRPEEGLTGTSPTSSYLRGQRGASPRSSFSGRRSVGRTPRTQATQSSAGSAAWSGGRSEAAATGAARTAIRLEGGLALTMPTLDDDDDEEGEDERLGGGGYAGGRGGRGGPGAGVKKNPPGWDAAGNGDDGDDDEADGYGAPLVTADSIRNSIRSALAPGHRREEHDIAALARRRAKRKAAAKAKKARRRQRTRDRLVARTELAEAAPPLPRAPPRGYVMPESGSAGARARAAAANEAAYGSDMYVTEHGLDFSDSGEEASDGGAGGVDATEPARRRSSRESGGATASKAASGSGRKKARRKRGRGRKKSKRRAGGKARLSKTNRSEGDAYLRARYSPRSVDHDVGRLDGGGMVDGDYDYAGQGRQRSPRAGAGAGAMNLRAQQLRHTLSMGSAALPSAGGGRSRPRERIDAAKLYSEWLAAQRQ